MSVDRLKKIGFAAAALALAVIAAMRLGPIIRAVFWSFIIAYLLSPVHRAFERRFPGNRSLALTFLVFLLCVLALPVIIVPVLVRDLGDILVRIPDLFSRIDAFLSGVADTLSPYLTLRLSAQALQALSDRITARLSDWLSDGKGIASLSDSLIWIALIPFVSFYMLKDREKALRVLRYLIPQKHRTAILEAAHATNALVRQFLRGQLTVSIIVGVLTALGLWAAGVRYALLLGIFSGLCNLIPYIGSLIAVIPVLLLSLLGGAGMLLRSLLVVLAVQQVESIVISPRVMGANLGIHPVFILLSVLAGGALYGFMGFLLALPAVIVMKGVFQFFQQRWIMRRRAIEDCKFFDE